MDMAPTLAWTADATLPSSLVCLLLYLAIRPAHAFALPAPGTDWQWIQRVGALWLVAWLTGSVLVAIAAGRWEAEPSNAAPGRHSPRSGDESDGGRRVVLGSRVERRLEEVPMATRNRGVPDSDRAEGELREQEVRRANKELAAYFKGERTEREARAALKIIKAFIRYRERINPANRRPLSTAPSARATSSHKTRKAASSEIVRRRASRRIPSPTTAGGNGEDQRDVVSTEPVPATAAGE